VPPFPTLFKLISVAYGVDKDVLMQVSSNQATTHLSQQECVEVTNILLLLGMASGIFLV